MGGRKKALPLAGRRIVITRRREQACELRQILRRRGATVLELPTIALAPPLDWKPLDAALARLRDYHWVVFTSANGVESFFTRLRQRGLSPGSLRGRKLAAIGPATARALRKHGLRADLIPDEFRAEGLLAAMPARNWSGKRVLIARAAAARELLPRELRRRGAQVDVVSVYRTVLPEASRERARVLFDQRRLEAITFTSPSTVRNFFSLLGRRRARRALEGVAVATIGPVTSRTARALGLRVAVEARRYTVDGLVRAIERYFSRPTTRTL